MSSRRRIYLDLKKSIVDFFRTPAYYLKENVEKQSIFEKPYLDGDYRKMHLDPSEPDWTKPDPDPDGIWPPARKVTFVFDEGICDIFGRTGECGELITINGWIGLVPLGRKDVAYTWTAQSSDSDGARIVGIETSFGGISASIHIELGDEFTGTVVVCAQAYLSRGTFLKEIAFQVPVEIGGVPTVPGWVPRFDWALKNLPPLYEIRQQPSWDCGCIELNVVCCDDSAIAWDSDISAETIAQGGEATVAITDSLGSGGPYSWAVGGSGFTMSVPITTGLSNTLNADDSACGAATVVVTGCDGNSITGYVRCTTGTWSVPPDYYFGSPECLTQQVHGCEVNVVVGILRLQNIFWCITDCSGCSEDCGQVTGTPLDGTNPECPGPPYYTYCFPTRKDIQTWVC